MRTLFALVALASVAASPCWAKPLAPKGSVAQTPASPSTRLAGCVVGARYSYGYLPPSQGGARYQKDNCTGQITIIN